MSEQNWETKMKRALLTGGLMLMAVSTAALAQTTQPVPGYPGAKVIPVAGTPTQTTTDQPTDGASMQQQLSGNLTKAGFTDVKITPDAFIIQAKNKSGDPVTMFLSPDSLTVFTAQDAKGKDTRAVTADQSAAVAPN
jgi:hypothetical protein